MVNLNNLKSDYQLNENDAAAFILMLSQLNIGDKFVTIVGTINKTSETDFELIIDDKAAENLVMQVLQINDTPDTMIFDEC